MSVDAHISSSTRQALVFPILNVLSTFRIDELFSQTKIDDMDNILVRCAMPTHEEVLRLHVTIDQVLAVYVLDSGNLGRRGAREREGGREGERDRGRVEREGE